MHGKELFQKLEHGVRCRAIKFIQHMDSILSDTRKERQGQRWGQDVKVHMGIWSEPYS